MYKIIITTFTIIGLSLLVGCLEEIDFARPDTVEIELAVLGRIVKASPPFVELTITETFNFEEVPRLIGAREVTVEDENGNKLELNTSTDGIFTLEIPDNHPTFKVEFGAAYRMNISTFDDRNYTSSFETLHPVPKLEKVMVKRNTISINTDLGQEEIPQISYSLSTPLQPEENFENARLLWEFVNIYKFVDLLDEKTCFVTGSPVKNYVVLDGRELSGTRIDSLEVLTSSLSSIYADGHYLEVKQQSLSSSAFDYWSKVQQVVQRTGSIFQAPAGRVPTNFVNIDDPSEELVGYFYATEESIQRVFTSPELALNPRRECPPPPSAGPSPLPPECEDCLMLLNSVLEQPSWWLE